jgi:hypothetical protein
MWAQTALKLTKITTAPAGSRWINKNELLVSGDHYRGVG